MVMVTEESIKQFSTQCENIFTQIRRDVIGQNEVVEGTIIAMIAGGNVLLEGVPGVGKTRLVRTLGRVFSLHLSRIQFTPDLMPADVTGTNIIVKDENGNSSFQFQPGPVFSNIVLADEINRATPKTQSALLEAMQEHTVTVMGVSRKMKEPFFVLATQNPIEQDGTYPLPEAQPDDGLLDVLLVRDVTRLKVAQVIGKYKAGQYRQLPDLIRYFRCKSITVEADHPVAVNLDGELLTLQKAAFAVAPEKIRFCVPQGLHWNSSVSQNQEKSGVYTR